VDVAEVKNVLGLGVVIYGKFDTPLVGCPVFLADEELGFVVVESKVLAPGR